MYLQLKDLIIEGKLKPGDRIPSERELCAQLGVSRTALREAKKALVMMGLLESRSGSGTFVRDNLLDFVTEPLTWAIEMERGRINELIEVRLIVETATAALAGERATDEDRKTLKETVERQQAAIDNEDREAFVHADVALHTAIAQAAQNAVLVRTNLAIRTLLRTFISAVLELPGSTEAALAHHNEIVEAILVGDADGARKAMEIHLEDVRRRILQGLGSSA